MSYNGYNPIPYDINGDILFYRSSIASDELSEQREVQPDLRLVETGVDDQKTDPLTPAQIKLVENHTYIAYGVASKYLGKVPFDRGELQGVALLSLVENAQRFDEKKGIEFRQYAATAIYNDLIDFFRRASPLSRRQIKQLKAWGAEADRLAQLLQRTPTVEEVSKQMGITIEEAHDLIRARQLANPVSLNTNSENPFKEDCEGEVPNVKDTLVDLSQETASQAIDNIQLDGVMRIVRNETMFTKGERRAVQGLLDDSQGEELAVELGVSPSRVYQYKKEAFKKIRRALEVEDLAK